MGKLVPAQYGTVNDGWTLLPDKVRPSEVIVICSVGHSFMGLLVSFLIVSRSKISYDRFMDFRRHLATTYRTCREIAQASRVTYEEHRYVFAGAENPKVELKVVCSTANADAIPVTFDLESILGSDFYQIM